MELHYAQTNLELTGFSPVNQQGFSVTQGKGEIKVDTVFEGRLHTEFHFRSKKL
jgi:hypothetical protein